MDRNILKECVKVNDELIIVETQLERWERSFKINSEEATFQLRLEGAGSTTGDVDLNCIPFTTLKHTCVAELSELKNELLTELERLKQLL